MHWALESAKQIIHTVCDSVCTEVAPTKQDEKQRSNLCC